MFGKGGTLGQAFIIARDGRINRTLNRDGVITVQQMAELNIRQCQSVAGQIPLAGDLGIRDGQIEMELVQRLANPVRIPLAGGGSDDPPEYGGGKVECNVDFGSFCPFIDIRPGQRLRWPKIQRAIAARQVA